MQNITATGGKGLDVLMSQTLLRCCLRIANNSLELETEAVLLLDLIVSQRWHAIHYEERKRALQTMTMLMRRNFNNVTYLRAMLRLGEMWMDEYDAREAEELTVMMTMNLIEATESDVVLNSLEILHRLSHANYEVFIKSYEFLVQSSVKISSLVNKAANNPKYFHIIRYYLRFLAKAPSEYFTFDSLDNMQIPKFISIVA